MAEATERKPADSKSQDAGREGDRPEYLVEKYGSVEDQAKGYAELEKKYHQDLDTLKAEVNSLKRGVRVEDLQPHLPPADTDNQELVDFYRSPSQYRRRVVEEAKSELRQENQQKDAVQQVLTRFFSQNSDLVGQEPLLEWYVRQEDPRLDPTDTRSYNQLAKSTRIQTESAGVCGRAIGDTTPVLKIQSPYGRRPPQGFLQGSWQLPEAPSQATSTRRIASSR